MITKLPNWIEYSAFLLAWIAGFLNAIGLLGFDHLAISHVSGTVTLIGANLWGSSGPGLGLLLGTVGAFLVGAAFSGAVVRDTALRLDRRYDIALSVEALLIFAAYWLLSEGAVYGYYAAAMACGVQNALATTYSGAIVRTTHLTGVVTDLGIMIGLFLRGKRFETRRAVLFLLILSGFVVGAASGGYLFTRFDFTALLAPAVLCLVLALGFRLYQGSQNLPD